MHTAFWEKKLGLDQTKAWKCVAPKILINKITGEVSSYKLLRISSLVKRKTDEGAERIELNGILK